MSSVVSEKTRLPLSLVAVLVSAAVTLAAGVAVAQARIASNTETIASLRGESTEHERRIVRLEATLADIRESLHEIRSDVKELRR